ncbi:hypothetical protein FDZ73_19125 [bacterium]|nr:MAG: hypothetical protein FDZ73_19125 [bacterium]
MKSGSRLLPLLAAALLSGCGLMDIFQSLYPKSDLARLRIVAEADANQTMATALDLVFIYDKTLIPLLPKSGPEWFAKKKSIVANQPGNYVVVSLEVPPGMVVDAPLPKRSGQALGVFLFANYLGKEGQFPVNLSTFSSAEIRLKANSIEYAAAANP